MWKMKYSFILPLILLVFSPSLITYADTGVSGGKRIFHMEEETIPLLIAGVAIVLGVCLITAVILLIKSRNMGYLFFIAQIVFIVLGFVSVLNLLNLKDNTSGLMVSENISLRIGIITVFWALSMFSMLAGVVLIGKRRKD